MNDAKSLLTRVLTVPLALALIVTLGFSTPGAAEGFSHNGATTAEDVTQSVEEGEIDLHAPEDSLDASEATVEDVDSDKGTYTAVTLPIAGSYNMLSNLTVVYDEAGTISQYSETLYYKNDNGNFQLTQYTNGKLDQDKDMDVAYMSDAELLKDMESSTPDPADGVEAQGKEGTELETQGAGAVASCIAGSLGVGGTVAYLIAGACAGSCVGQVYPVCAACIGGYAALGSAGVGAVAACFQLL